MKKRAVFKPYIQHQTVLLPPSLEELIPQDHLVRVVNFVIDQLDIDPLLAEYKGGGTSSYHPRMMLKAWVFGYMMKVHSCRTLAKALREHIPFMWLAGMQQPDFRTLNDFRTKRMKGVIGDVFKQVVLFCLKRNILICRCCLPMGLNIKPMPTNTNQFGERIQTATRKEYYRR